MQSTGDDGKVSTAAHTSSISTVLTFCALLHRKNNYLDHVEAVRALAILIVRAVGNAEMATLNPARQFESDMRSHTRAGQCLIEHAPQCVLWKSCVIPARP
jgi:hypothetical protein